jgi:hypothetical protein
MPLHFIMRDGLDIELPVVVAKGGLIQIEAQIAARTANNDGLDFAAVEVDGIQIAIRADEILAVYSEDEARSISVRHSKNSKRLRVERDGAGRVVGINPA